MNDEEFLAGKNELMCREIDGVLSEERATEIGKRILLVTSNPTGIGQHWIRKCFTEEQAARIEVVDWDTVKVQEPGQYDVMFYDEESILQAHDFKLAMKQHGHEWPVPVPKHRQGKGPRGRWGKLK